MTSAPVILLSIGASKSDIPDTQHEDDLKPMRSVQFYGFGCDPVLGHESSKYSIGSELQTQWLVFLASSLLNYRFLAHL